MKKVLVVEDEITTRKLIAHGLEAANFSVFFASNGRRALSILEDNPDISLLVTDMLMPEMDGRQLIEALQSNPATKSIPVIIVSGVIALSQIVDLLDKGASRFIPKPIKMEELVGYAKDLVK